MRRTPVLILVVAIAVIATVFLLTRDAENTDVDIAALARQQAIRESNALAKAEEQKSDLESLARKGLGQAVPDYLVSQVDRSGNFWFVGKPGSDVGVEVPFEPGKIPDPKSTAEPLGTNPGFLGADACRDCHQEKHETFIHTAHYRTSRLATSETVSGPLEPERNRMRTGHPNVSFAMTERSGDVFQEVSFFDWRFEVPMHLIIGSDKMAETYLYWHGDKLFQGNCTHLSTVDAWINSPGYIDGDAAYARPIQAGCLECHVTYIDVRRPPNHYTPSSLVVGISCERCHGPGKEHVEFHASHPDVKEARHVTVPSQLPRREQMELCGQCHTGEKAPRDEPFQFRPGDLLEEHYVKVEGRDESSNSVHTSNQVARLALSECFKQSEMACVECHNPHQNERGQSKLFSQRCLECHQSEHCGMSEQIGPGLADNCIDCHMPKRSTTNLRLETPEGDVFPPLRDHYIRVDQQATDEYLQTLQRNGKL